MAGPNLHAPCKPLASDTPTDGRKAMPFPCQDQPNGGTTDLPSDSGAPSSSRLVVGVFLIFG